MKTEIPFQPMFFPTKVAIIDDEQDYLEQINLLVNDDVACELFTSPLQALKVMRADKTKNERFVKECSSQWGNLTSMVQLEHDMTDLHRFVYDDRRFDRFSIMVVDYDMPEMNGLELCQQLRDPWIKKILITGKADSGIAIQAFNRGLIDQFIRKEEENIDLHLNAAIDKLSHQYFTGIYASNHEPLSQKAPYLLDKYFVAWFKQLCQTHDVVEYYLKKNILISEFLLVDRAGAFKFLILQTPEQATVQYEVALDDKSVPEHLLTAIHNRDVIPHFSGQGVYDNRYNANWREYVYAAKRLNDYAYVLLEANDLPELGIERVGYSYHQFLNDFYAEMLVN